ncbi:MAG: DUF433 domain-containing protein [Deltaproteobacteria bacterium]|nr:MAG: DUF433 domain-containing protein [Deltaproteobacteria bacterium]
MNNSQTTIVRDSRGLSIAGTRITLYDVMDYVTENWPPELVQYWLNLTDRQIKDAMDYIENNRAEVEAEYRLVLKQAEEIRQYWEDHNREHFAKIREMPRRPGKEGLWMKLKAEKTKLEQEYGNYSD